jgi:hypothetical protein
MTSLRIAGQTMLADALHTLQKVFGEDHPQTKEPQSSLKRSVVQRPQAMSAVEVAKEALR